jgi:hypothetical protein
LDSIAARSARRSADSAAIRVKLPRFTDRFLNNFPRPYAVLAPNCAALMIPRFV